MWLFLNNSFLSIVANRENKSELLVRSRTKGDIERVFGNVTVAQSNNADYKYRAFIERSIVAEKLKELSLEINYDNFKSSIQFSDNERQNAYLNVWSVMQKIQK